MRKEVGNALCNWSYGLFLTAGAAWTLARRNKDNGKTLTRAATTVLISTVVVQTLKLIVPERRPDSGQKGSFPSGHSANTIALATLCSAQHPEHSLAWYVPALGISLSRIALRRHHIHDVIVGSLLGFMLARHISKQKK